MSLIELEDPQRSVQIDLYMDGCFCARNSCTFTSAGF